MRKGGVGVWWSVYKKEMGVEEEAHQPWKRKLTNHCSGQQVRLLPTTKYFIGENLVIKVEKLRESNNFAGKFYFKFKIIFTIHKKFKYLFIN